MRAQEIIAHKRDGGALTEAEIAAFVGGYTSGEMADYQASALLMAIYLRGMNEAETAFLTGAMAASGQQLDLSDLERVKPTIDKHSTGGVGDKTSLVVVPILAACGLAVCKMSGRGLGHTGGTLDKLESIPGLRVDLTPEQMLSQVREIGACLAGQTGDLAPADKKIYALRDATATVGSLPLIVSSILSKKLAGGAKRFLFDVKVGSGALMKDMDEARALANALVSGATAHGRSAVAVVTDMSQPLGRTIGNALEIAEAIQVLTPTTTADSDARFRSLCVYLAAQGLCLGGLATDLTAGEALAEQALTDGSALRSFRQIVAAQGGDVACVDNPDRTLPAAPIVRPVPAPQSGFVAAIDAATLGEAVVRLGGGRSRKEDVIDPAVGIVMRSQVGAAVSEGAPLCEVHARTEAAAEAAVGEVLAAFRFAADAVEAPMLVHAVL